MGYTSAGLPNNGHTPSGTYIVRYDKALSAPGGPEPMRSTELVNNADQDFAWLQELFGGATVDTPITLTVKNAGGGAHWSDSQAVDLMPDALGPSADVRSSTLRYLVISEVSEIFMMERAQSWYSGSWLGGDEGSKGECLSVFLAALFMIQKGLGSGPVPGYNVSIFWLNSSRDDFLNHAPDDNKHDEVTGCGTLFMYYMYTQLKLSAESIIRAGAGDLAGVYENATRDNQNPFPTFKALLGIAFPATIAALPGPNIDDPFPLPTTRSLSTRRFISALGSSPELGSVRLLNTLTGQRTLRGTLNTNRQVSLV